MAKAIAERTRVPTCTEDGFFEDKQCDDGWFAQCWCVDQDGTEIEGTKDYTAPECSRVPGKTGPSKSHVSMDQGKSLLGMY
jgi:hypothetical protein